MNRRKIVQLVLFAGILLVALVALDTPEAKRHPKKTVVSATTDTNVQHSQSGR